MESTEQPVLSAQAMHPASCADQTAMQSWKGFAATAPLTRLMQSCGSGGAGRNFRPQLLDRKDRHRRRPNWLHNIHDAKLGLVRFHSLDVHARLPCIILAGRHHFPLHSAPCAVTCRSHHLHTVQATHQGN